MSRHSVIIATLVLSLVAAAPSASAEPERLQLRCTQASPASIELDCTAAVEVRRDVADRTHTSIFPTGNLLRDGEVSFQVHEFGMLSRAAIGLSDNVEVSVSAPLFPILGGVGIRAGLLPRDSRFRAVVGAGLWSSLVGDEDAIKLLQTTVTVAYQNERLNLHGTVSGFKPLEHDDAIFTYSAGFVYKVSRKGALIGEALRLNLGGTTASDCADYEGDCGSDGEPYLDGALLGVKLMGEHFDTDLGLFLPLGESDLVGLPVVSMTYRY